MKKLLMTLPLVLSLLSPVHAATTSGCPDPSQISTMATPISGLYIWNFFEWYGMGFGLGGSQVGSLISQNQTGPGMYNCTYNSNLNVSKADITKNIDKLPEKSRPQVQYLQGNSSGYLMVTELFSSGK